MRQKDKMTADNVEQLLEIVRAVQRGDDPVETVEAIKAEEARIRAEQARIEAERRRAEQEAEAAAREEAREEARIRRAERAESFKNFLKGKKASEEEWDEEDEFLEDTESVEDSYDEPDEIEEEPVKPSRLSKPSKPARTSGPSIKENTDTDDFAAFSMPKWTMPKLKSNLEELHVRNLMPDQTVRPAENTEQPKTEKTADKAEKKKIGKLSARPEQKVEDDWEEEPEKKPEKKPQSLTSDEFFDDDDDFEKTFEEEEKDIENPLKGIGQTMAKLGAGVVGGTAGLAGKLKTSRKKKEKAPKEKDKKEKEKTEKTAGFFKKKKQDEFEDLFDEEYPGEDELQEDQTDTFFDDEYESDFQDEMEDELRVKRSRLASLKVRIPKTKKDLPKTSRREQNLENKIQEKDLVDQNQGELEDEFEQDEPKRKKNGAGLFSSLKESELFSRDKIMLAIAVFLGVVIIFLLGNFVIYFLGQTGKGKNVVADEGLKVSVEDAPREWTNTYPVALRFKVDQGNIVKVEINGEEYGVDGNGNVTVQADTPELDAVVTTEYGDKHARIEIAKIDVEPPVVNVSRDGDNVVVTAADGRSEVVDVQYAALSDSDFTRIPLYEKYTGPFPHVVNTLYYFYAEDAAGNKSNPVITTAEKASRMELEKDSLLMFPDEECYVPLVVTPTDANVENLLYESVNPEIVTVAPDGLLKAKAEGSTVIHITADELPKLDLKVEVSLAQRITITALGDCTFGDDDSLNQATSFSAFYNANGENYFFDNVRKILENDDVTFANFEGTLTESNNKAQKTFNFKGDPAYTGILEDGSIDVVTLSNNHINDYGEEGVEDTVRNLEEAGIEYCMEDKVAYKEVKGIKLAFIGIFVTSMEKEPVLRQAITDAKEEGAQIIVVALHGGSELATEPDPDVYELAHIAVDEGATLVVGHHPHTLERIEKYKGRYIAYSIGNFCFGGNYYPADLDTIIFRQTFTVSTSGVQVDDDVKIIPCSISSGQGYNNYQPTPSEGSEAERIMNKLNNLCAGYDTSFTASTGLEPN